MTLRAIPVQNTPPKKSFPRDPTVQLNSTHCLDFNEGSIHDNLGCQEMEDF